MSFYTVDDVKIFPYASSVNAKNNQDRETNLIRLTNNSINNFQGGNFDLSESSREFTLSFIPGSSSNNMLINGYVIEVSNTISYNAIALADGTYYLYFSLVFGSTGILISDSATGTADAPALELLASTSKPTDVDTLIIGTFTIDSSVVTVSSIYAETLTQFDASDIWIESSEPLILSSDLGTYLDNLIIDDGVLT